MSVSRPMDHPRDKEPLGCPAMDVTPSDAIALAALVVAVYGTARSVGQAGAIERIEIWRADVEKAAIRDRELSEKSADIHIQHEIYTYQPGGAEKALGFHRKGEVQAWRVYNTGLCMAKEIRLNFLHAGGDETDEYVKLLNDSENTTLLPGLYPEESVSVYTHVPLRDYLYPVQVEITWRDSRDDVRQPRSVRREIFQGHHRHGTHKPRLFGMPT